MLNLQNKVTFLLKVFDLDPNSGLKVKSIEFYFISFLYQVEPVVWTSITTSRKSGELWCG
jgi:hypothetical protein